jgi:hypothetical protein
MNQVNFIRLLTSLIIIVVAKESIILNEESLLIVSCLSFIYFVIKYAGGLITESLNIRAQEINQEFSQIFIIKKQALNLILNGYNELFNLKKILSNVFLSLCYLELSLVKYRSIFLILLSNNKYYYYYNYLYIINSYFASIFFLLFKAYLNYVQDLKMNFNFSLIFFYLKQYLKRNDQLLNSSLDEKIILKDSLNDIKQNLS